MVGAGAAGIQLDLKIKRICLTGPFTEPKWRHFGGCLRGEGVHEGGQIPYSLFLMTFFVKYIYIKYLIEEDLWSPSRHVDGLLRQRHDRPSAKVLTCHRERDGADTSRANSHRS